MLVNHIHRMADLLHMDVVQQLEVALLGSPASRLVDILMKRLKPASLLMRPNVQPPQVYMSSPPAPAPQMIPIVGVTSNTRKSIQ